MSERKLECDFCKENLVWGATICKGCGAIIQYEDLDLKEFNSGRTAAIWLSAIIAVIPAFIIGAIFATPENYDSIFLLPFLAIWLLVFIALRKGITRQERDMVIAKFSRPKHTSVGVIFGGD